MLVPPHGVVTLRLCAPAEVSSGKTTVIVESLTTVKLGRAVPSRVTDVAPVKPLPVMAMVVPPASGPELGETPVTTGGGAVTRAAEVSMIEPTAMQPATEGHAIPFRVTSVEAVGGADQLVPSHCSTRVPEV